MAIDETQLDAQKETEGTDNTSKTAQNQDQESKKSGGLLKILLIASIPTIIIIAIVCVLLFTSFGRGLVGLETEDTAPSGTDTKQVQLPENITYYEMPELLVNIQSASSKRKPYLRLAVKFEVHDPDALNTLDLLKPRIIDSFQVYLRELRVDDLEGSAGSQRLKEELLKRVNAVSAPVKVMDVLFQVFVVQ